MKKQILQEVKEIKVGVTLTRIIVTLPKGENLKVNVTKHIITNQFSDNGFCIDNTYFKIYKTSENKIKHHYISKGYGAEMFIVGCSEEEIRKCEDRLIKDVKEQVEASFNEIMSFKNYIENGNRNYISEVDKTPWGEDKSSFKDKG